ncbi:DNA cytosine methyltransferase, partial [Candidatus Bathyarchaeota archaeon]|nr:DNA cytosine methyltransferase [Candidatus Bathyarchaeota archaeon]
PIGDGVRARFGLKKKTLIPLDKDDQCPTLTTLPDDYIHYSEPRILTVREYARIQSFNDWFEFKSNYTTGGGRRKTEVPRYTQVGNAVPPLFAELCGTVLRMVM